MANGSTHDRIGLMTSGLLVLPSLLSLSFGHETVLAGISLELSIGCAIGTLYLSPDLDVYPWRSVCQGRWDKIGFGHFNLGWIWEPYRRMVSHRNQLSHSILLGSVLRVLYLAVWLCSLLAFRPIREINFVSLFLTHWEIVLAVFIGIELSALVHYLLDGLISEWMGDIASKLIPYNKGRSRRKRRRRKTRTL